MNQQDWDIKTGSGACHGCEKPFEDQQSYSSRLTFGEEGYQRSDYCETCWEAMDEKESLSFWKTVFKAPPPPKEEPVKKGNAESLLRRLMEEEKIENQNTIYILAVMLERKRVFIERDVQTRKDGVKLRVYEHKKSGESFIIPDPDLRLNQLESVQEDVVRMLGGKPDAKNEEEDEGEEKRVGMTH